MICNYCGRHRSEHLGVNSDQCPHDSGRAVGPAIGILLIVAAAGVTLAGYLTVPSAGACSFLNAQGITGHCSSTPSVGYFVAAGILAGIGLLLLALSSPWGQWRQRLMGGGGSH
jgi:hypothetical protein